MSKLEVIRGKHIVQPTGSVVYLYACGTLSKHINHIVLQLKMFKIAMTKELETKWILVISYDFHLRIYLIPRT